MIPDSTVPTASAHPNGHPDRYPTVTLAEYAALTGQSARTVRDKVRRGQIPAELVKGPHGFEYRLCHPDSTLPGTLPEDCGQPDSQANGQPTDTVTVGYGQADTGIGELVGLVERQQQTIIELSGRCGFLQAKVQDLEREIRLLQAPPAADLPNLGNSQRLGMSDTVSDLATSAAKTDTVSHLPSNPAPAPHHSAPSANGPVRGAECLPRRPWWAFWRWIVPSGG